LVTSDERLPAVLDQIPDEARRELADFLRASHRPHATPADVEEELSCSLSLKESLSPEKRQ
jgi:hypothetical protein